MDKKKNMYIAASYQLYDVSNGKNELLEETTENRPFDFISGMGIALEAFENALNDLKEGDKFDFILTPAEAYGDYNEEHVTDLDKTIFTRDGKFDEEFIYVGAIVPLQNEEGERFNGHVLAITDDAVKMDFNHPLAGKTLNFKGEIKKIHEASAEEMADYVNSFSKGCGGGCGGNCGEDGDCNCHDGGCGGHEGGCGGNCGHH